MNLRSLILSLYVALFAGLGVMGCVVLHETWEEYRRLARIEDENQRRLAEAEARLKNEQLILERLRTDPVYVDKVIRQKLGYVKPDEFIFRFNE